ncbi:cytochrome b5-like heme/steroid binding domain-containing protein [Actinomyces howellii]|uniref:Soluble cytochrome b558 n=1 Tax=Actinomyces howellii TaxID=52771 RepID=A0A3S4TBH4_9ACTO|nr:cytochrome b5 domain-containing protein [Actinomyces howellii]VEG30097.1 Soluble cytochrome b558 [Actinomyces howellii]
MDLDLPLHPLVVHAPVVLLPLTALGVVVLAVQKRRAPQLAYAVLGLIVLAVLATGGSVLSGNALAELLGFEPERHERWGLLLAGASVLYLAVAGPWLWKVARADGRADAPRRPWALASAGLAVLVAALTVLAGHSGAELAWSDVGASPDSPSGTAPTGPGDPVGAGASTSVAPTPDPGSSSTATVYTMEDVARHSTAESCWTVIDSTVYDLTDWVSQHPGGQEAITGMCGTDGTAAFTSEHGGQAEPADALAGYAIGTLG